MCEVRNVISHRTFGFTKCSKYLCFLIFKQGDMKMIQTDFVFIKQFF